MNTQQFSTSPTLFIFAALILLALATGNGNAQLGKPTYATPVPAKPVPAPEKSSTERENKSTANKDKFSKKNEEMGVSGGTICNVDPDLCPDSPRPLRRNKVTP